MSDATQAQVEELLKQVKGHSYCVVGGKPEHRFPSANIMVVAPPGSGKSAFQSTAASSLAGQLVQMFRSRASADHVTTREKRASMARYGCNLSLWDDPGFGNDWIKFLRVLACLILGKIKHGEVCHPLSMAQLEDYEHRDEAPYEDQVHCLLILLPVQRQSPDYYNKIRDIVTSYHVRVPSLVLLTKCDTLVPGAPLTQLDGNKKLEAAKAALLRAVPQVNSDDVLPVVSYVQEVAYRNYLVEKMALTVILRALSKAEAAFAYRIKADTRRGCPTSFPATPA